MFYRIGKNKKVKDTPKCSKTKWRKRYNTLLAEHELLKETMREDVYKKTIKKINEPLTIARYQEENKRLRQQLSTLREENSKLRENNKELKKNTIKEKDI